MKYALLALIPLIGIFAFGWLLLVNDAAQSRVFSPINEQTRRMTFEESKAYREGNIQDMYRAKAEYLRESDPTTKKALANLVVHRFAGFPRSAMPSDLQLFYSDCLDQQ